VYVSDSGEVLSAVNELRQNLGLEELPEEEDEAEEAEEETP
jgi:hypothetical protein